MHAVSVVREIQSKIFAKCERLHYLACPTIGSSCDSLRSHILTLFVKGLIIHVVAASVVVGKELPMQARLFQAPYQVAAALVVGRAALVVGRAALVVGRATRCFTVYFLLIDLFYCILV